MRTQWATGLGVLLFCSTTTAQAADKQTCITAHNEAQVERQAGHLGVAATKLAQCTDPVCPALIRKDCVAWLSEVQSEQPSIVIDAKDGRGKDIAQARVFIDSAPDARPADGRPIELDPGTHDIAVVAPSGARQVEKVVVRVGEKSRVVRVVVGPAQPDESKAPASEARPARTSGSKTGAVVASVVAGAGFATFGVFGVLGTTRESELTRTCAPNCSAEDKSGVDRQYLVADVGLAVGVVATGLAVWLWLQSSDTHTARVSPTGVRF